MKWFSLKGAIVFYLVCILIMSVLIASLDVYLGLSAEMMVNVGAPLPLIIYFLVYAWKWSKGEAKFP